MNKFKQFLSEAKTEINGFATHNNIYLIKKSQRILNLDVNGVKVKVTKRAKNKKVGGSGVMWGEIQQTVRGTSFVTDLFGERIFDWRTLELALLEYSKNKNKNNPPQPDYKLDNGTYGLYKPFISFK